MKKKQENYYLLGRKTARKSFKGNFVLYFKHLVYLFGSIISMLSIVFYPVARVAKENIAKELKDNSDYQLGDVFDELDNKNKVWRVFVIHAIRYLIIFALIMVGIYLSKGLFYLVAIINSVLDFKIMYFELYFIIPMWTVVTLIGFILLVKLETGLKVATNGDYTISESFKISTKVVGAKDVFKVFLFGFVNLLEFLVYVALALFFVSFISSAYGEVIALALAIILTLVLIFILIKRLLATELSISYYLDNVIKVKNVDVSVEIVDYQAKRKQEILSLFNDEEVI